MQAYQAHGLIKQTKLADRRDAVKLGIVNQVKAGFQSLPTAMIHVAAARTAKPKRIRTFRMVGKAYAATAQK